MHFKKKIKIKPLFLSLFLVTSFFGAPTLGMVKAADEKPEPAVIPEGITIEGRNVGGMDAKDANGVISEILHSYDDVEFTLIAENDEMVAKGEDLNIIPVESDIVDRAMSYGKRGNIIERFTANSDIEAGRGKDFSLSLTSDWNKTKKFLEENTLDLESAPIDNTVVRTNGTFKFVEGKPGIVVDTDSSATAIADFITADWKGSDARIDLAVTKEEPKGSREQLESIKDLLGACSTNFASSTAARAGNVKNGTSKLDKSVIYPGEEFSVSKHLGSRNEENGYFKAPSYENGTTVDTYGGGVCQISTTLYNAVIRSELEVVERHPHSMVVAYVKPSMDAAISEGAKDFVFKNNLKNPIYIEGYTAGGELYFNIFGKDERPAGREVKYESEVVSTTEPGEKYVANPGAPIGSIVREQGSHTGYTARLWKVVTENGKEVSRDVFNNSAYRASPAIYNVGVGTDNAQAKSAMSTAIGSQNKETIQAAASQWSAAAVSKREQEAAAQDSQANAPATETPSTPSPAPTPAPAPTPSPPGEGE